ncbi:MAG: DUF748 domain-containing protein [Bacteroidetes bacterium]|nr:DUF748 domain-containing protein [Bacteroidota bacterium]
MRKFKIVLLVIAGAIVFSIAAVIACISPITKYLVEKYDEKLTGREITMDWAYVNPLTGDICLSNLEIYERHSDSIFISARSVNANLNILKLFCGSVEIRGLALDHPIGKIIQDENHFNFTDLIEKFSSKDSTDTTEEAFHFSLLNLTINNGIFYYQEKQTPINFSIEKVFVKCPGIKWDSDIIAAGFSFFSSTGGSMKGCFGFNVKTENYRLIDMVSKFDLNIVEQYLKDFTNEGKFSANFDADILAMGNLKKRDNVVVKGMLAINDFHCGITQQEDYASFDKLEFAINGLSPKNHLYLFDTVSLSRPFLKYSRYDYLDNLQIMFGKEGENIQAVGSDKTKFNLIIQIASYIKMLSKNFFRSNYKVNRLEISNGNIEFNDYSISEKFSVNLNPLFLYADSIDKNHKRIDISAKSGIIPFGRVAADLSVNPRDTGEFDLTYNLQKIPTSMLNPYLITYTSYPFDKGEIEINGIWKVRNGFIQSNNHLLVMDPRVTKQLRNKGTKWVPVPLIMTLIRERGSVIDYEIPISGNLKDPKFHLRDVLSDLGKNLLVKPASIPYRIKVNNTKAEIEKSLTVKWEMRQSTLESSQEKFIKEMADFLADNPEASIIVAPQQYEMKEKEYILLYEAKKRYYLANRNETAQSFKEADSHRVEKTSIREPSFILFLDKNANTSKAYTIQEKCTRLLGYDFINTKFEQLVSERENAFLIYFKERGVAKQVKIVPGKNLIPFNGFSFYKISYKGEFPESIIEAYLKMSELNNKKSRKKHL